MYSRVRKFADSLRKVGVSDGDVISVIAPNSPSIFEAHYAIPGCANAVLHTINTRLDAATIAFQLNHSKCKVLLCDSEHGKLMKEALALLPKELKKPIIIDIVDPDYQPLSIDDNVLCGDGKIILEDFISRGSPDIALHLISDEWYCFCCCYNNNDYESYYKYYYYYNS